MATGELIRPQGRPTIYTEELAARICELVANGASCRQAAEKCGIDEKTIRLWQNSIEAFYPQYARALELRADYYFEWIIKRANAVSDKDDAQVARVQIDAIKWACSKLAPRRFGDKLDLTVDVTAKRVVSDL